MPVGSLHTVLHQGTGLVLYHQNHHRDHFQWHFNYDAGTILLKQIWPFIVIFAGLLWTQQQLFSLQSTLPRAWLSSIGNHGFDDNSNIGENGDTTNCNDGILVSLIRIIISVWTDNCPDCTSAANTS